MGQLVDTRLVRVCYGVSFHGKSGTKHSNNARYYYTEVLAMCQYSFYILHTTTRSGTTSRKVPQREASKALYNLNNYQSTSWSYSNFELKDKKVYLSRQSKHFNLGLITRQ